MVHTKQTLKKLNVCFFKLKFSFNLSVHLEKITQRKTFQNDYYTTTIIKKNPKLTKQALIILYYNETQKIHITYCVG